MTSDTRRTRLRSAVRCSLGVVAAGTLALSPHVVHAAASTEQLDADGVELLDSALEALDDADRETYDELTNQAFDGTVWLPTAAIVALDQEEPDDIELWLEVLESDDDNLATFAAIAITWERDAWNDLESADRSTPELSIEISYADQDAASLLEVIDRRNVEIPDSARLVLSSPDSIDGELPDDAAYAQALADLVELASSGSAESPADAAEPAPPVSAVPTIVIDEAAPDAAAPPATTSTPTVATTSPESASSAPLIIAIVLGSAALLLGLVGAFRTRKTDQLADIAFTDGLTGLSNRRRLDADTAAQRARGERTTATLMVDVDHFKKFNDTHGHALGDEVLRRVGAALSNEFRKTDVPYRYGGEEFCVLLHDTTPQEAHAAGERARAAIAAIQLPVDAQVTASVGVSTGSSRTIEQTIERADAALYGAKESGRNCVVMG